MKRHIVLIGLPGSGKTTIGGLVAERLGGGFVDSDMIVVRKMQMPILHIFATQGETRFREMEREIMEQALSGPPSVLAPGGGWAVQPGHLEAAKEHGFVVYLKTMVTTASKRAASDDTRPVLAGEDPLEQMRNLLREREPIYSRADAEVKNDTRTPESVADEIVTLAKEKAGWS
jgi:shikimate kinase